MKSLKLILPVMVFVFAIVGAFGSNSFLVSAKGERTSDGECITGTLVDPPMNKTCSTTTGIRCQVEIPLAIGSETVPAFTTVGCIEGEELYYPE